MVAKGLMYWDPLGLVELIPSHNFPIHLLHNSVWVCGGGVLRLFTAHCLPSIQALSDPDQREIYDRSGEEGLQKHRGGDGGSDMFSRYVGP